MNILFYIVAYFGLFAGIHSFFKTRDISNPPFLTAIFFILPLLLNRLKLSELQAIYWDDLTYLILSYYILIFGIIPFWIISRGNFVRPNYNFQDDFKQSKRLITISIIAVSLMQLGVNYLNCGYFIPALHSLELQLKGVEFHTVDVGFWGMAVQTIWLFVLGVSIINAFNSKSIFLWFLTLIGLLVPVLTRFSRLVVVFVLILAIFLLFDLVKDRRKFYVTMGISVVLLALSGTYMMYYRWSVGGKYKVSLAKEIKYKGDPGPMEIYSSLYAYLPLSFENVDRFVEKNKYVGEYTYGAYTFRPICVGLLKLQKIFPDFPLNKHFERKENPLNGVARVSTAVPAFTVDFGFALSFIPMLIYSFLGLILYLEGRRKSYIRFLYFVFSFQLVLASFQNYFIDAIFVYILVLMLVYKYFKRTSIVLLLTEKSK